jgi:hypothetical protein
VRVPSTMVASSSLVAILQRISVKISLASRNLVSIASLA